MKELMLGILSIIILIFLTAPSFSAQRDPFALAPEQKAYNEKGEEVGVIKKEARQYVFYDNNTVTLKYVKKNEWGIYNREGKKQGKLVMENFAFKLYDRSGKYTGFVINVDELSGKTSQSRVDKRKIAFGDLFAYVSTVTAYPSIHPEAARLCLYVMQAIK